MATPAAVEDYCEGLHSWEVNWTTKRETAWHCGGCPAWIVLPKDCLPPGGDVVAPGR